MEKNGKGNVTFRPRSNLDVVVKAILLLLCVVVAVLFVIVAKGFASINDRLDVLEEKGLKHDSSTERTKRSIDKNEFNSAMNKLKILEESDPGVEGGRGPQGPRGPRGVQGEFGETGVSYIRWGKKTCPNTEAILVYEGYVGGSNYNDRGGGSNYVCLSRDPIYVKYQSGYHDSRAKMYGAEYQSKNYGIYPSSLYQHDVPCAVCHVTRRASQLMIPGRNVCPAGWTREYKGYLMAERHNHHRTMFTCVDEYPDYTQGTHANVDGALFYFVEGVCGSLPCKPYIGGKELTCAVCTR